VLRLKLVIPVILLLKIISLVKSFAYRTRTCINYFSRTLILRIILRAIHLLVLAATITIVLNPIKLSVIGKKRIQFLSNLNIAYCVCASARRVSLSSQNVPKPKRPWVCGQNVPRSVGQNVPKQNLPCADQIFFQHIRDLEIKY